MQQPVLQTLDFRLSYADCDPAGIVYYAAYYPWFERMYNEWCLSHGFPTNEMVELWGTTHISVESGCEYRIPGRLFDPFQIRMRLRHMGTTSFSMSFDVDHRETDETYATGHITFVFIDTGFPPKPVQVPEKFKQELAGQGAVLER